jgi:hypothetical protein
MLFISLPRHTGGHGALIWGTDTACPIGKTTEAEHAGKIKAKVTLSVLLLNFYFFMIFNNY